MSDNKTSATPAAPTPPAQINPKELIEKIKSFYAQYVGRTGFNPYFYLHSCNFFDIEAKVANDIPLTAEDKTKLQSIVLNEANARPPKAPVDLYRSNIISANPVDVTVKKL